MPPLPRVLLLLLLLLQVSALAAVRALLSRWSAGGASTARVEHLLDVAEAAHAKAQLLRRDRGDPEGASDPRAAQADLDADLIAIRAALPRTRVVDVLCFNPAIDGVALPTKLYCLACGEYASPKQGLGLCRTCHSSLTTRVDYDAVSSALVWTGVLHDLGIEAPCFADATVTLERVTQVARLARPYRSLAALGLRAFVLQCYLVTHVALSLSRWGRRALSRVDFLEEYLFLAAHMRAVEWLDDPELVGEFVAALAIFCAGD